MRTLKLFFILCPAVFLSVTSFAQMIEDPTTWKYEVKKIGKTEYELIFHLTLKKEWHIWSLHPGGDGYEIAPSFTFDANPNIKIKGAATEKGKPITTKMEGIEGKITYFTGKVDYTQDVTVLANTKITGKLEYQVCNDKMCLPPKDKEFSFEIK